MSDKFTKADHARMIHLINELSKMGSHGWNHYTYRDWQPLEEELSKLLTKRCQSVREVRV